MKPQFLYPILLLIGGVGYGCIELAARGYTHWTMVVLGGLCLAGRLWSPPPSWPPAWC